MTEETRIAIEENLTRINPECFEPKEIQGISFQTFRKYIPCECYTISIDYADEMDVNDVLRRLNSWGDEEPSYTYKYEDGTFYECHTVKYTYYRIQKKG